MIHNNLGILAVGDLLSMLIAAKANTGPYDLETFE